MSNRQKYSPAQRKAWGKKMAAARAAKAASIGGRGAYYKRNKATGEMTRVKKKAIRQKMDAKGQGHSGLWSAGGGALAAALGLPPGLGMAAGNGLGSLVKSFTGFGDYKQNDGIVNNSLFTTDPMMTPIVNGHSGSGDVFRRSEYIADVVTHNNPNTFEVKSYNVNPGLENTFQWLSQLAVNYEEYSIEGLYFEFRSMSADALNSTNTALGQVIMAANYNAASPAFRNKQEMENYQGGISAKPSSNMRFFLECAKNQSVLDDLYVRNGAVPAGQDQRLYDLAKFQVATNGFQAGAVNVGELWISYQVCLRKSKLYTALGLYNSYANFTTSYSNTFPIGGSISAVPTYNVGTNIEGLNVIGGSSIAWSPPTLPQMYFIMATWNGGVAVAGVYPTITTANGLTLTGQVTCPLAGVVTQIMTTYMQLEYIPNNNTNNDNPTITFGSGTGTLPTTPVNVIVRIYQLPNVVGGI